MREHDLWCTEQVTKWASCPCGGWPGAFASDLCREARLNIHIACCASYVKAMYLALVVERATVGWFQVCLLGQVDVTGSWIVVKTNPQDVL